MKRLILILVLISFLSVHSQDEGPSLVFDHVTLDVIPAKMGEFGEKVLEHNKTFHSEAPYTARIYNVQAGSDAGKIIWNMGPCTFADMDKFEPGDGHTQHWIDHIMPTLKGMSGATYWKFHPEYSNFQKDITLNMLYVTLYDLTRGQGTWDKVKPVMERFTQAYRQNYPDDVYGVYSNMVGSTKEGHDIAIITFMDNYAAMEDSHPDFVEKYEAMHGAGSHAKDIALWMELTQGADNQIWTFIPDLSTGSPEIMASERQ